MKSLYWLGPLAVVGCALGSYYVTGRVLSVLPYVPLFIITAVSADRLTR